MLNTINQYNQLKDSENLVFAYRGNIDDELISSILSIIENKLGMVEYNSKLKKKIFNIIVELVQNVFHNYQENKHKIPNELHDLHLMLVKHEQDYEIYCGNYLLLTDVNALTTSIQEVNQMSTEELRNQYRERLDSGVISKNGRAGLGIMDIVRKSNNKMQYQFDQFDDKLSLFSTKVKVNINS